jgi:NADP-dependent 3-hydroxy acid dehydrogenase YdfG
MSKKIILITGASSGFGRLTWQFSLPHAILRRK